MDVQFAGLGPIEVRLSGASVALGSPKQRAVLGVLLISAGRSVSVDRLVDEVWGDGAPSAPARSVQVYVSALRAVLGPHAGLLETTSTGYRLAARDEQVDVRRFERAAVEAKTLLARGELERAAATAEAGLSLWRGPAFSDLADFGFARLEADRLEALRTDAKEDLFDAAMALGRHHEVLGDLERLVAQHPLRERLLGQLMVALHRSGRQPDALAVYRAHRTQLVDELGLEPGQVLQKVHQSVLRDDPQLRVEPAELRARRHLPAPATPLVGRRAEINALTAMVRDPGIRLVTATGPGGIGKTRLALQAVHEVADAFRDGVFFVALAALRDPGLVLPTVAAALGVEESPEQPWLATLQGHLEHRQALLLLDNLEQVDDAARELAELLGAAPELTIVATSRTRLRLYGEHDYPVPLLALHDEAVPLFNARARAADPAYRADEQSAEVVREICQRLDCLPLAIELAAARVNEVAPQQMLRVLSRRLELADAGPRDLAPRQQSLRAAIDWSFQLLSEQEQRLFTGLAVFIGGSTVAAVVEVCGGSATQLSSLVAKNLLVRRRSEDDAAEGVRFDMLETIREYALDTLHTVTTDHETGLRDRHARHYLQLAEAASDELRGPNQLLWMSRLDAERENLRAALTYLTDRSVDGVGTAFVALRLAAALGFYWYKTGTVAEGSAWLTRALDAAPSAPGLLRGRALHALGILVAECGDAARALQLCERSCELFRQAGDRAWVARSLNSQGGIARDTGDLDRAERMFAESADLRRRLGDDRGSLAVVLANLMMLALDRRDLARARLIGEECLDLAADSDQWTHAVTLQLLADVAVEEGDLTRAGQLLRQALPVLRRLGTYRLLEYIDSCAGLAGAQGRPDVAARLMGAVEAASDDLGARIVPADALLRERRAAAAREHLGEESFDAIRATGRRLSPEAAVELAASEVLAGW